MLSFPTNHIMFRCVLLFYLLLPVDLTCDSDESVMKLYRDKICNLPKIVGSCKLKWKRFYYNRHTGDCEQFIYEGETFILINFH